MFKVFKKLWFWSGVKYRYENYVPERGIRELKVWRNEVKENPARVMDYSYASEEIYTKKELSEIYFGTTEMGALIEKKSDEEVLILRGSKIMEKSGVEGFLLEGIERMKRSLDPSHNWLHVRRTIQIARVLWKQMPKTRRPEWGEVVLALVWHDAARVDWLGPAEDGYGWLKKVPGGQDFSIVFTALRDAQRSAILLKRAAKRHGIPSYLRKRLVQAVRATANKAYEKKESLTRKDFLIRLIHDADSLDILTIGRFEDFLFNVRTSKVVDEKFRDRFMILSWLFVIPRLRKSLSMEESRKFHDSIKGFISFYVRRFHKSEADIMDDFLDKEREERMTEEGVMKREEVEAGV